MNEKIDPPKSADEAFRLIHSAVAQWLAGFLESVDDSAWFDDAEKLAVLMRRLEDQMDPDP